MVPPARSLQVDTWACAARMQTVGSLTKRESPWTVSSTSSERSSSSSPSCRSSDCV